MNEIVEQGIPLKKTVLTLISFTSNNLEIVTIQDVMHCLQLATYWLNKGIAQYYGPSDSRDIAQEVAWREEQEDAPVEEMPTEAIEQLKYMTKTTEGIIDVVSSHLRDTQMDAETKFCLTNAKIRLIEATFNIRMTVLAYEGLQSIRRGN